MSKFLSVLHLSDTHLMASQDEKFINIYPNQQLEKVLVHAYFLALEKKKSLQAEDFLLAKEFFSLAELKNLSQKVQLEDSQSFAELFTLKDKLPPFKGAYDWIFNTGDIIHDAQDDAGWQASYQQYYDLVERYFANTKHLTVPGNHDVLKYYTPVNHQRTSPLSEQLTKAPFDSEVVGSLNSIRLENNQLVILLSTKQPEAVGGRLTAEQAQLLEELLASDDHPILLMHHNPYPSGCTWMDGHQNLGFAKLREIIEACPTKATIIHGHIHQCPAEKEPQALEAGVKDFPNYPRIFSCPSTAIQFKPGTKSFTLDTAAPGYRTYLLSAEKILLQMKVHRLPWVACVASEIKGY